MNKISQLNTLFNEGKTTAIVAIVCIGAILTEQEVTVKDGILYVGGNIALANITNEEIISI
ncbi:hypothetical protein D3C71_234340 [compost metagenome]